MSTNYEINEIIEFDIQKMTKNEKIYFFILLDDNEEIQG